MSAAVVTVRGLGHTMGRHVALDGVDLDLQGGIISVLGANGAGKTTLLRCLATVLVADRGQLTVDGLDPRREGQRIEIRRRLGHVPQRVGFDESSTVFDLVDYFAILREIDDDRRRRRVVLDALAQVGLLDRAADRAGTLSGGMQRRLAVAQALLRDPTLVVLDEPSAGLDPDERHRLRTLLSERAAGATVVVATHLTDEAALGSHVVVLDAGRVRFVGTPIALASQAQGRVWIQSELPPPGVRGSWRQPDGRHRCLGLAPPRAELVEPTVEDGYLVLTGTQRAG